VKKAYLAMAASLLLIHGAYAGDGFDVTPGWIKVVTLSAGPTWSEPGENQLYNAPFQPNFYTYIRYIPRKEIDTIGTGEAFMALQHNFTNLAARLGIAVAGSTPVTVRGTIALDGQPLTNYSYKVGHIRVSGKALLIGCPTYWINPYVSGSIGMGFNSTNSFETTNQLFVATPGGGGVVLIPFGFDSKTQTSVAVTVGTGVNVKLNSNWEVGVGYEFASWGESNFSRTPTISNAVHMPELNNIYTHELLFSLSFLY
jgi:opacity protein-like surface antigen